MQDSVKQTELHKCGKLERWGLCVWGTQLNRGKPSTPPQNRTLHADQNHLYSFTDKEQREERGFT